MFEELVDIKENNIKILDFELLNVLLKDNTTGKNILWATDNYLNHGSQYGAEKEILPQLITGYAGNVIKPRTMKSKAEQLKRSRDKAEVFTPAWICNKQNNLIDNKWFGYEDVFNKEINYGWKTLKRKIIFKDKNWEDYIKSIRLEITCGEAPYLVSRYDTTTGDIIPVMERIGFLDRKFRIINENISTFDDWIRWVRVAYKSIYGYEWQGDSLLIARENLLYTFSDNYVYKFHKKPSVDEIKEIATIISFNLFQMDGTKFVIPYSCKNEKLIQQTLFGEEVIENECEGCKKGNIKNHNGIYAKIMNWETNRKIRFITVMNRSIKNGKQ
jgi:hypothetical protein